MFPHRQRAIAALLLAAALPLGCQSNLVNRTPVAGPSELNLSGTGIVDPPARFPDGYSLQHHKRGHTAGPEADPEPTPTPIPTATATPTPSPVASAPPSPTPVPTASSSTWPYPNTEQVSIAQQVLTLVNGHRSKAGVKQLVLDLPLTRVALARSQDMITRNYFSHIDPDGHDPFWWIDQYPITYSYAGENIAWGYRTADEVVGAWMSSDGHRRILLSPYYGKMGLGFVKNSSGTPYWTQNFTD